MDANGTPAGLGEPRLPFELEREIFEIATLQITQKLDYRESSGVEQFLLVAKRVQLWVEPFLHHTLMKYAWLGESTPRSACKELIIVNSFKVGDEPSPGLRRLCSYARHVLMQCQDAQLVAEILNLSPNTRELALWLIQGQSNPTLVEIIRRLPLERLSVNITDLFSRGICPNVDLSRRVTIDPDIFPFLTHLDLIGVDEDWWDEESLNLLRFPRLSHLALYGENTKPVIDATLSHLSTLVVLVLFFSSSISNPVFDSITDPRFVQLVSPSDEISHFENGARTGEDFWKKAEALVKKNILIHLSGCSTQSYDTT